MAPEGRLKPFDVDFIIYHHPCFDGCAAASVAIMAFQTKATSKLKDIVLHPTNYGRQPPDVTGRNVLICDFSYPEEQLTWMIQNANNLLVIDHHQSAEKNLASIDEKYKIFDMNHCGAYLTWEYFINNPDGTNSYEEVPLFIKYVEDQDLWKHQMKDCDAFSAWLATVPFDPHEYLQFYFEDNFLSEMKRSGEIISKYNKQVVERAAKNSVPLFTIWEDKNNDIQHAFVTHCNFPFLKSAIAAESLKVYPYADMAAVYHIVDRKKATAYSIRSTDKYMDASLLAEAFGGGGHRNACGLYFDDEQTTIPSFVSDNGTLYDSIKQFMIKSVNLGGVTYYYCSLWGSTYGTYITPMSEYYLQVKYGTVQVANAIMLQDQPDFVVNPISFSVYKSPSLNYYKIVFAKEFNDAEIILRHFNSNTGLFDAMNM